MKKYEINNDESWKILISIIESQLSNMDGMCRNIAVRGLYRDEIGNGNLSPSHVWIDGNPTDEMLSGTSAVNAISWLDDDDNDDVRRNAIRRAMQRAAQYGDTNTCALITGMIVTDETCEDAGEIILRDAHVIGYIR